MEMEEIEAELSRTATPDGIKLRIMELAKIANPRLRSVIEGRAGICASCRNLTRLGLRCGKSPCSEQFSTAKGFPFIDNKLCNMAFSCPLKYW